MDLSNRFAPEHLSIPDDRLLPRIRHAGSVFIGPFSTEAAGDYASGPNHVLPTGGAARLRGGLSVSDFLKVISVQHLNREALAALAPAITTLARAEGLGCKPARWTRVSVAEVRRTKMPALSIKGAARTRPCAKWRPTRPPPPDALENSG